jgi:uncharacterized protein YidB (DUF937 family)
MSVTGSQAAPAGASSRYPQDERDDREPGGLADVLRAIFGGGSVPGPVLRRGVDNTVLELEDRGHWDVARSWVSRGPNKRISPQELESALGERGIRDLMQQTDMERGELPDVLAQHLPRLIDHLTPDARSEPTKKWPGWLNTSLQAAKARSEVQQPNQLQRHPRAPLSSTWLRP